MATLLLHTPSDPEDELLRFSGERDMYMHGKCHSFACALHAITGWQIVSWQYENHVHVGHLGVRDPHGALWDARGQHTSIADFVRPFTATPPDTLEAISLEELLRRYPDLAEPDPATERIASMMFPGLPHLPTSDRSRTVAFMNTVEVLSRAHVVWIVAANDALHLWPIIGEGFKGVSGYRLLGSGRHFTFDRAFERDVGPELGVRYPAHILRFVIELTALSQKHNLWLRAPYPTALPRLVAQGVNDCSTTQQYVMTQSLNGGGFFVNLHRE